MVFHRETFQPETLSPELSELFRHFLLAGIHFPFCRFNLEGRLDFEIMTRNRLYLEGERTQVAGLSSISAARVSWRQMTGFHTASGTFKYILPDDGGVGALLPTEAEPIFLGDGPPRNGSVSEGYFMFRRAVCPEVLSGKPAGLDTQPDYRSGILAVYTLLLGEEYPDMQIRIRTKDRSSAAQLCRDTEGSIALSDSLPDGLGLVFRPTLPFYGIFRQLAMGNILPQLYHFHPSFWEGAKEALRTTRTRTTDRGPITAALRMAFRAGLGIPAHIAWRSTGELELFFATSAGQQVFLSPDGNPVSAAQYRQLRQASPAYRRLNTQDIVWRHCRVSRIILPVRIAYPTSEDFTLHPSGLVYSLLPGDPFLQDDLTGRQPYIKGRKQ